uniref:Uncharacterized protein n=1 Tax=Polytomella parva TaxID=51329 RepID=A0A7S0YRV7_9CHLO|mmetsp:Transcript_34158/g.61592  ORF Transcript_34158/g.61592 Transcript_34158/m.61592 type:complete len:638 (+) Transcript_34158:120-2033(+)|eukprot:CAMPEP_0175067170 /NCGR_PEP_ID=MMETSP0052_2-20121109/16939_1 /TAXON_ID=51329 ORGANISM="Polytomella parva, Strain SAG 63-3" /NCGR_SAMPLE_ID=MMETSP0052_2 /ASSEMBLY_ACC=CAM_ASM_000194 /LENGTH=637 /DNA_ID=CAMNT_0016334001 /DNA_START=27 /DNA_END=1940 /DNA_ORIENTATION=+
MSTLIPLKDGNEYYEEAFKRIGNGENETLEDFYKLLPGARLGISDFWKEVEKIETFRSDDPEELLQNLMKANPISVEEDPLRKEWRLAVSDVDDSVPEEQGEWTDAADFFRNAAAKTAVVEESEEMDEDGVAVVRLRRASSGCFLDGPGDIKVDNFAPPEDFFADKDTVSLKQDITDTQEDSISTLQSTLVELKMTKSNADPSHEIPTEACVLPRIEPPSTLVHIPLTEIDNGKVSQQQAKQPTKTRKGSGFHFKFGNKGLNIDKRDDEERGAKSEASQITKDGGDREHSNISTYHYESRKSGSFHINTTSRTKNTLALPTPSKPISSEIVFSSVTCLEDMVPKRRLAEEEDGQEERGEVESKKESTKEGRRKQEGEGGEEGEEEEVDSRDNTKSVAKGNLIEKSNSDFSGCGEEVDEDSNACLNNNQNYADDRSKERKAENNASLAFDNETSRTANNIDDKTNDVSQRQKSAKNRKSIETLPEDLPGACNPHDLSEYEMWKRNVADEEDGGTEVRGGAESIGEVKSGEADLKDQAGKNCSIGKTSEGLRESIVSDHLVLSNRGYAKSSCIITEIVEGENEREIVEGEKENKQNQDATVEPFSLDPNFDYDNIKLTPREFPYSRLRCPFPQKASSPS